MQQAQPPLAKAQSPLPPQPSTIPQFVVLHDKLQQSWKHPFVHYVFEDEPFPPHIVPKDHCIIVEFAQDGETVKQVHSQSHNFQVTNYKISSTPTFGSGKESGGGGAPAASLMLTIEGMSAGKPPDTLALSPNPFSYREEMDQTSTNMFGLDELLSDFKRRNELLRQILGST
ncbi:4560_t:CDS:2 [Ambispora leptoticha]|uniref:4560_t:CDS:1 n=1 Tax=Ambispora leptoticha TaxID=144679 RepID=A0A9N8VVA2_9GLOM|nr:4560_t:CDS:2 [Ambispora leptoticha]